MVWQIFSYVLWHPYIVIIFSITFIMGILGNILIIIAVAKKMTIKSPTNTFLASLATTDLILITICLPVKV